MVDKSIAQLSDTEIRTRVHFIQKIITDCITGETCHLNTREMLSARPWYGTSAGGQVGVFDAILRFYNLDYLKYAKKLFDALFPLLNGFAINREDYDFSVVLLDFKDGEFVIGSRSGLSLLDVQVARDNSIVKISYNWSLGRMGKFHSISFCPASLFNRMNTHRDIDEWEDHMDLPKILGSVKQVDWSRSIRFKLLPKIIARDHFADYVRAWSTDHPFDPMPYEDDKLKQLFTACIEIIMAENDCSFWINNRNESPDGVMKKVMSILIRKSKKSRK